MKNDTPSMIMYAAFKNCGISNYEAASLLLNTQLTFDGKMIRNRIEESSQLSRRIVRTAPGELSIGLFNDFRLVCPRLTDMLAHNIALRECKGDVAKGTAKLAELMSGLYAKNMSQALDASNIEPFLYENMVSYFSHVELPDEDKRALLHTMLFTITGCIGDPRTASILTVDYASSFLDVEYQTAPTTVGTMPKRLSNATAKTLGLVRVIDGCIKSGARMHALNAAGTELGILPEAKHTVSEVESDVSRRHAFIWEENGQWFIQDLGSINGTRLISGSTGETTTLDPNGSPLPIRPTDIIQLASKTSFLVMPILDK